MPAAAGIVPEQGKVYPAGTVFRGECGPSEQIPESGTDNQKRPTSFAYSTIGRYRADSGPGQGPYYPPVGPPPESWGTGGIDAPESWTYADTCNETFAINRPGHYLMQVYRTTEYFEFLDYDNEPTITLPSGAEWDLDLDDTSTSTTPARRRSCR